LHRIRASLVAILTLITLGLAAVPVGAVVAPQKVVIIVGPVGAGTTGYRADADVTATAAAAAGATVVKVYSPTATWANVKAAVNGANIVVYFGHGNGFPNPYTTVEYTDRVNGWGLNRTTSGGDGDDGYSTMAYCGEKALLGTLTPSDGATQQTYCKPGPITPAPGWVMIYAEACYAPGASQSWEPRATEAIALAHAKNYSYPALKLGASAYFATDMYHGSAVLVDQILRYPSKTYAEITAAGSGYSASAQRHFQHPDLPNAQVWLQRTGTDPDYRYAFAGNPFATPDGNPGQPFAPAPLLTGRTPAPGATGVATTATISATFNMPVTVSPGGFLLTDATGAAVPATVTFDPAANRADLVPASPLKMSATYTVSLNGLVMNSDLLSLAPTYWSFQTVLDPNAPDATGPAIVARWPAANATGVTMTPSVTATFSEPVGGVGTNNTVLRDASTSAVIPASVTYDASTLTATLRPLAPLLPGRSYKMAISGSVRDLVGNPLTFTSWTFKTTSSEAYSPARSLGFAAGTYTGYRFSSTGAVLGTKAYTLARSSSAPTSRRAAISGQSGGWYYISAGVWSGYWIRDVVGLYLY